MLGKLRQVTNTMSGFWTWEVNYRGISNIFYNLNGSKPRPCLMSRSKINCATNLCPGNRATDIAYLSRDCAHVLFRRHVPSLFHVHAHDHDHDLLNDFVVELSPKNDS